MRQVRGRQGVRHNQNAQGQQQVVQSSAAAGPTCTLDKFGGEKFDLASAVVGFSQSEKEANPFRIAETGSIKAEAKKLGISKLRATNAQSQFGKQISDVQQLIAQGAKALVIAPLNSDGWEPVLQQAAARRSRSSPWTGRSTRRRARTT